MVNHDEAQTLKLCHRYSDIDIADSDVCSNTCPTCLHSARYCSSQASGQVRPISPDPAFQRLGAERRTGQGPDERGCAIRPSLFDVCARRRSRGASRNAARAGDHALPPPRRRSQCPSVAQAPHPFCPYLPLHALVRPCIRATKVPLGPWTPEHNPCFPAYFRHPFCRTAGARAA